MRRTGTTFSFALAHIQLGIEAGLIKAAKTVMEQSLVQVPVDTGALKSSATDEFEVTYSNIGVPQMSVTFGYAIGEKAAIINPKTGRTVDQYAIEVHEIGDVYHAEPTKYKFLEDPVNEFGTALGPVLADAIKLSRFADITGEEVIS